MRAHTAIVGGGVMGASIALHLARELDPIRDPVVLFERRGLAAGSSGRSGAILRQHYSDREVAAMARDSLRFWSSFERTTGRSIGFRACGVLTLAGRGRPDQRDLIERNVAMQRSIGIDTRLVGAAEARELVPGIVVEEGSLGAWEPGAGTVEPRRAVEEIAALARSAGATTRLGEEVRDVLVEGGRVRGLRTDEREVECRRVVVAAGPWTRPLLAELGIALPLKVVRPLQGFLRMPATALEPIEAEDDESPPADARLRVSSGDFSRRPAAHAVLLDLEHGYYARCEPEAERTRVGGMDYGSCEELDDPDDLDESVDPAFRRWARGALERRMPVYQRLGDAGAEAAWYTLSPDSQALIGPAGRFEGLWVVSGFSGHGFKLAPSVGEGVAQMVLGRPVSAFDPAFFDPARFAGAAPRRAGAFGL